MIRHSIIVVSMTAGFGLAFGQTLQAEEKPAIAKVDAKTAALSKPSVGADSGMVPLSAKATGALAPGALRDRAKKGDPQAQYLVGRMYDVGRGVKRNRQAAFGWFEMAARGQVAAAHYKIGLMHLTGELGAPNLVEAYARFRIAAKGGDVRATAMLFYIGPRMNSAELKKSGLRVRVLANSTRQTAAKRGARRQ